MKLSVTNWTKFQHYKDRTPPWIKLHRTILSNMEWNALSDFAARLLIEIWLLASEEENDGNIEMSVEELSWRLRHASKHADTILSAIEELINHGFVEDASGMLAQCSQHATPETETETEADISADSFEEFWDLYDYKDSRERCRKYWIGKSRLVDSSYITADIRQTIMDYLPAYIESTPDKKYRRKPAKWLYNMGWENEIVKDTKDYDPFEALP